MYVDAMHDRDRDTIHVVERDKNGKRQFIQYPPKYLFYFPDAKGKFKSIYGDNLNRFQTSSGKAFQKEKKTMSHHQLFESDCNVVFRCLADEYANKETPKLNVAFFDIEVDFNKDLGFAPSNDPFNALTAVAVHLAWLDKTICLVIKPKKMSQEEAEEIVAKFDDTYLMESEEELLHMFLDLIDDADILSGWNSEGFDIPYTTNRIARVIGRDYTRKLCLWQQYPKKRKYESYGSTAETYDLVGRIHLDYMQLYKKYTYHEMHSYSLDAIAEEELDERKLEYEGTLDQLYNNDFEKFIAYNIQDTELLRKLDDKLQFIDLSNVLAHENGVLLPTTMGAVAQTDQAIINEAHERGLIVPDKQRGGPPQFAAAGAYVAVPKHGMHHWIGSMDLNSLYPSILRSCNMSPENIVAQIRHTITLPGIMDVVRKCKGFDAKVRDPDNMYDVIEFMKTLKGDSPVARYWDGRFATAEYELVMAKDREVELTIDFEDGNSFTASGAEIYQMIFEGGNSWALSANGTVFTFEKKGVIPGLLERWYAERKVLQGKAKDLRADPDKREEFDFWDKRQLVKKINLNSLYGALLNPGSRFFDQRLGQSTTLTGRCIARHMAAGANEAIDGTYDYRGKAIIYGDTDSVYFSAYPILKAQIEDGTLNWDKDSIVEFYDAVAAQVDSTFPKYMREGHNCPQSYGEIIAAGREIVAESGIFITKKRYGMLVFDDEGNRVDIDGKRGKIKVMGLEIKRSDTPAYMQDFLKEILQMALEGQGEKAVLSRIKEFRKVFRAMSPWEKGTPKRVNNLTGLTAIWNKTGKCRVGHAMAAINYNRLREMNADKYSIEISDGMKTIVCKTKDNPLRIKSIGIPTDEKRIPEWYKELPFDEDEMEHSIVTKKIENLLGTLDWDLKSAEAQTTYDDLFEF
jgi:DNA polymerase elongation subunit (family B)